MTQTCSCGGQSVCDPFWESRDQKALWVASGQIRGGVGHCGLKVYFTGNGAEKTRKDHPGTLQTEKKTGSVNTTSKELEFKCGSRSLIGQQTPPGYHMEC